MPDEWNDQNPVGAALAGALAAAEVHQKLNGLASQSYIMNAFDGRSTIRRGQCAHPHLPPVTIAGVGAVGSAICQVLAHVQVQGRIDLIDNEELDDTNCIRYVTGFPGDEGQPKATDVAKLLRQSGVEAAGQHGDAVALTEEDPPELMVCAMHGVDERHRLAANLAKTVVDVAVGPSSYTTASAQVEVSVASFAPDGPCVSCLYHEVPAIDEVGTFAKKVGLTREVLLQSVAAGAKVDATMVAQARQKGLDISTFLDAPLAVAMRNFCGGAAPASVTSSMRPERIFGPAIAGILTASALLRNAGEALPSGCSFRWDTAYAPSVGNWQVIAAVERCANCSDVDLRNAYAQRWRAGSDS